MVTHRKIRKWMVDYIEGTLPERKKGLLKGYIAGHPGFDKELDEYIKVNKLVSLKATPELSEGFWNAYLPRLKRRLEMEPVATLGWLPAPVTSLATIALVILTIVVTVSISKPPTFALGDVPRSSIAGELVVSNSELDYYIAENYESEEIVEAFFPREMIHSFIGGEFYEGF